MIEMLLLVLVMILAGALFRPKLGPTAAKDLNQIVFYFTLPPLIIHALHGAHFCLSVLSLPLIAWIGQLLGGLFAWGAARLLKLSRVKTISLILITAFGNTTFFGYPVISALYGAHHLSLAVIYDLLGAGLAINTVGILLASSAGPEKTDLLSTIRRLVLFPPIWALFWGLLVRKLPFPPLLDTLLLRVGGLTTPLIMFSIGLSFRLDRWREDGRLVLLAASARLFLVPLALWMLLRLCGLPLDLQQAAVMQTAMPTMFFALTLALLFGLDSPMILNGIILTTFLSLGTLPLWAQLLTR